VFSPCTHKCRVGAARKLARKLALDKSEKRSVGHALQLLLCISTY